MALYNNHGTYSSLEEAMAISGEVIQKAIPKGYHSVELVIGYPTDESFEVTVLGWQTSPYTMSDHTSITME